MHDHQDFIMYDEEGNSSTSCERRGLLGYYYRPNTLFAYINESLPSGYQTSYTITLEDDKFSPTYTFRYESNLDDEDVVVHKNKEEYEAFLKDVKNITKFWLPIYWKKEFDGFQSEAFCPDINLDVIMICDAPANIKNFRYVINKHFLSPVQDANTGIKVSQFANARTLIHSTVNNVGISVLDFISEKFKKIKDGSSEKED